MLAKRLDHVHLGVTSLRAWEPLMRDVLGLSIIRGGGEPEPGAPPPADGRDMYVTEWQVGDGFIALLQGAGPDTQIGRFVDKRGEGFYAVSIDVGNLDDAAEALRERGVPHIDTRTPTPSADGSRGFVWVSPGFTKGVALQMTWPWSTEQGTNPNLTGLSTVVIAVPDIDAVLPQYRALLDLEESERVRDDRFGYEAAVLRIGDTKDRLLLAVATGPDSPFGQHVAAKGAGIFQFTLTARDLPAEIARLKAKGVRVTDDGQSPPRLAWIDPADAHGVRIELAQE